MKISTCGKGNECNCHVFSTEEYAQDPNGERAMLLDTALQSFGLKLSSVYYRQYYITDIDAAKKKEQGKRQQHEYKDIESRWKGVVRVVRKEKGNMRSDAW